MWVVVFLVVAGVGWAASAAQSYLTSWVGERILTDLRVDLFEHVQRLDLGFFERTRAGVVISRLTNDIEALETLVTDGPTTLLQNTITLIGSALVLLYLDWQLALATLTVFPGMAIATALFRRYSSRAYRRTRERLAEVTASLQEDISGVRVVQAFRRERANERRFHEVNGAYREANVQTVNVSAVYFPVVDLLSATAMAVVLGYGGVLVINGQITTGDLFVFIGLLSYFFEPVQQLSQFYQTFLAGNGGAGQDLRRAGHRSAADRPAGRDGAAADHGPGRVRGRPLRLPRGQRRGAARHLVRRPAGPDGGAGRPHRRRQVDASSSCWPASTTPPAAAILVDGHDLRDVTHDLAAPPARDRAPGGLPVRPQRAREHRLRPAGREPRGGRGGGPRGGRRTSSSRRCPSGYDTSIAGARRAAVDRPAPAGRVRPRAAGRPAAADPGRGDLERRHPDRGADRARAGDAARRPHGVRRRPPALDDPPRRRDRRARARRGHRVRHPRAADRRAGAATSPCTTTGSTRSPRPMPQEIPANARYQGSAGADDEGSARAPSRCAGLCGAGAAQASRAADRRLDLVLGAQPGDVGGRQRLDEQPRRHHVLAGLPGDPPGRRAGARRPRLKQNGTPVSADTLPAGGRRRLDPRRHRRRQADHAARVRPRRGRACSGSAAASRS